MARCSRALPRLLPIFVAAALGRRLSPAPGLLPARPLPLISAPAASGFQAREAPHSISISSGRHNVRPVAGRLGVRTGRRPGDLGELRSVAAAAVGGLAGFAHPVPSQLRASSTETRPLTAAAAGTQAGTEWMECYLRFPAYPSEKWLLGGEEAFGAFSIFLQNRGLQGDTDVDISCDTSADGRTAWGSRQCQECMKVVAGGPYGQQGVTIPAHPPQQFAEGCLALSVGALPVDLSAYYDRPVTGSIGDDSYDASKPPTATAFCRVEA